MRFLAIVVVLLASPAAAFDEVLVSVNAARSSTLFQATGEHSVGYSPLNAINTSVESSGAAPNQWAVSNNWGLTQFNVLNSYPSSDSPAITIAIGGLAEPRYEVFARVFVNSAPFPPQPGVNTHAYGGKFSIDDEGYQTVSFYSNGTLLSEGIFANQNGWFQVREYHLGAADAINGSLSIRVDDFAGSLGHTAANVAGFRLIVVPEPSAWVLGAMAIFALASCRRRLSLAA